jgi:hypothetical protein
MSLVWWCSYWESGLGRKQQLTALLGLSDDKTWLLSAARGRCAPNRLRSSSAIVRPQRAARHADIDLDAGTWVIPTEHSKNAKEHTT